MPALPDAAQAPTVEFKLFKTMSYGTRVALILCFLVGGVCLQLLTAWWSGLPLVFFGALLGLCNGVTNKPSELRFGKWENVTFDHLRKVEEMLQKSARWGRDFYGLTSCIGCLFFLLLLGGIGTMASLLLSGAEENSCYAIMADGFLMFFLLFVTGRRVAWEPDGLRIKLQPLLHVCEYLRTQRQPEIEIVPMLELQGKGDKLVPRDCKLMLKLKRAPAEFLGIQAQTSLNDVQGTKYPYLYCVLLAKPGARLVDRVRPFLTDATERLGFFANANDKANPDLRKKRYGRAVAECDIKKDVELVVIRQVTLGTGYHTNPAGQIYVVRTAIDLARNVYGL